MYDMIITTPEIEQYIKSLLPPRHEVFLEMEEYAKEHNFPIIGPMVGNFLSQLAAGIGARRVMELGSGFGYSALWLASALPDDARIICTEGSEENRDRALWAFDRVGVRERIDFRCGDALGLFSEIEGDFDFIFCDIDKHEYPDAFHAAMPRVRPGGFLVFDNALRRGLVLGGDDSAATRGVVELNRIAFSEPGCQAAIVPIRDGVLLCRKLD